MLGENNLYLCLAWGEIYTGWATSHSKPARHRCYSHLTHRRYSSKAKVNNLNKILNVAQKKSKYLLIVFYTILTNSTRDIPKN